MEDTLLARAPTAGLGKGYGNGLFKGYMPDKVKVRARFKGLFEKRRDYEARWKCIRDYQLPYLGYFSDTGDVSNPARRRDEKVYNGIAWEAAQVFASGVMSGLTPPSRQWFKFCFADRGLGNDSEACAVLDERQDILMGVLAKSNFYNAVHSVYTELPFGQCPLAIFPHCKTGVYFMPFTVGSYALDVNASGEVNCFARKYRLSASQLLEQFGEECLPGKVRDALRNNGTRYTSSFTVCWLVEENGDAAEGRVDRFGMPYRSLYWVEDSELDEWLYVGGFHEWPVPTARYLVSGNEAYAKGPGWFAEGDAKMLQLLEKDCLMAVELGVKPPMQATANSVRQGINLIPGGATIVEDLGNPIVPLFNMNMNIEHLQYKIKETEGKIRRVYSADLFLMLDQLDKGQMTAREVMERTQEKLQQLGPVVERLQFEFLNPILERVYGILDRAGVFPDFPDGLADVLDGQDVKIEYISPLAQAQKMSGLVNIEQAIAFTGQMSQLWPEVVDKIDPLETVNRYLEMLGAPATIRRSNEVVGERQAAKEEKLAKQMEMEQLLKAAPALNEASKAVGNVAKASGEDGLKAMLGM